MLLVTSTAQSGVVFRGPDEIIAFFRRELARRFWYARFDVFTPLSEDRIAVEGRVRWGDDERVMRDDRRVWALEFRDGLVYRSLAAPSVRTTEATLDAFRDAARDD